MPLRLVLLYSLLTFGVYAQKVPSSVQIPLSGFEQQPVTLTKHPAKWVKGPSLSPKPKAKWNPYSIEARKLPALAFKKIGESTVKKIDLLPTKKVYAREMYARDNAKLNITYLDARHGLNLGYIHMVEQLPDGRILFSCLHQLVIYDGFYLTFYNAPEGFGALQKAFWGPSGKLWIAAENGCYFFENDSFFKVETPELGLIQQIFEDSQGRVWLATFNQGIVYIDQNEVFQHKSFPFRDELKEFEEGPDGKIWIALYAGVLCFDAKSTTWYPFTGEEREQPIELLFKDGILYMGRHYNGLYAFKEGKWFLIDLGIDATVSPFVMRTYDDNLWLSSYGGGMICLKNDNSVIHIYDEHGMQDNSVMGFFKDKHSNLWIGTNNGLYCLKEDQFVPAPDKSEVFGFSKAFNFGDTSYYAYPAGETKRTMGQQVYQLNIAGEDRFNQYSYISFVENSEDLYLNSHYYMFGVLKGSTLFTYDHTTNGSDAQSHSVTKDRFGRLWASTLDGKLKFLNANKDTVGLFQKDFLLSKLGVRGIHNNGENQTLVVTPTGLGVLEQTHLQYFDLKHNVRTACLDQDNRLVLFCDDAVIRFSKNQFEFFPIKETGPYIGGVPCNIGKDLFFIAHDEGFTKVQLKNSEAELFLCGRAYGNYLLGGVHLVKTGSKVYYSSYRTGTFEYAPNWLGPSRVPNAPKIHKIKMDKQEVTEEACTSLLPSSSIYFELRDVNWGKNRKLLYRLTRNSENGEWIELTAPNLPINNLRIGDYVVEFASMNDTGISPSTSFNFTVLPNWYNRNWFYLLVLCVLIVAALLLFRRRSKMAKLREAQLAEIIEHKTKEIASEKKLVERELEEKGLLLKEVNHRVMNNMQMVASVLDLQQSKVQTDQEKEALAAAIQRIKALAFAHQHFYKHRQYEKINLKNYLEVILKSLTEQRPIQVTANIEADIEMGIERAQALGLIFNELLSNSIKHAWDKDCTDRTIEIDIQKIDENITCRYRDNGKGKSESKTDSGIGAILIDAFIERSLQAERTLRTSNGYEIEIKFAADGE